MRVSRLEIFGFKSFRDRFVLDFDKDVIGIVGPNGCGKSNIVDSLRWVLGETHAKQLRGAVFDDLIFNGSESHRPLGMAEVSITIRPSEGWSLPQLANLTDSNGAGSNGLASNGHNGHSAQIVELHPREDENTEVVNSDDQDLSEQRLTEVEKSVMLPEVLSQIPGLLDASEIQLTRRLYRSGESEYFINRTACRLRDMVEVYRVLGLGARGLSIVQQGQVGEILTKKPVERRELLEEAAGISGFRARMEAAERKLVQTNENLARLADIILEVDKQVKILRVQAKRAEARNELKNSIKVGELSLFSAKSSRILIRQERLKQDFQNLAQTVGDFQAALQVTQAEEEELRSQLEIVDSEVLDVRRERDAIAEQVSAQQLKENEVRIELAKLEERLSTLLNSLNGVEQRKITILRNLSELESKLGVIEVELAETTEAKAAVESELKKILALVGSELDSASEIAGSDSEVIATKLIEKVTVAGGFEQAVGAFLASAVVVETRAAAEVVVRKELSEGNSNCVAVTKSGEVYTAFGWLKGQGLFELLRSKLAVEQHVLEQERELRQRLGQLLSEYSAKSGAVQFTRTEVARLKQELEGLESREAGMVHDREELESRRGEIMKQIEEMQDGDTTEQILQARQLEATYRGLDNQLRKLEQSRSDLKLRLAEVVNDLALARRNYESSNSKQLEQRLQLDRCEMESKLLLEEIQKNYGVAVTFPTESEIQQLLQDSEGDLDRFVGVVEQDVERLRRRLEREGEVDPDSIVRHQEEEQRLQHLQTQQNDLQQAVRTLEKTSRELKEISKKRFLDTFVSVSEKFTRLVPQLFGGGSGRLELVAPDDPLASGVELSVRPPGKNVRTMDLLSGGEKALAATALLMAMFLHRPSPICVLDEVDAPLDDTNLERFLGMIRANVDKAQFLIITHNKLSMAASDRLVGITMQEKGVSTALSVTLSDVEHELERQVANML